MKNSYKFLAIVSASIVCALVLRGALSPDTATASDPLTKLHEIVGEPEYKKLDPSKPIHSQTRKVEIAGRKFEIPIVYLSGALDKGENQDGINFSYVLPEFTSKADFRDRAEYKQAFNDQRFAGLLLEEAKVRPPLERMIERRRQGISKEEFKGRTSDGLDIYDWYYTAPEGLYLSSTVYLRSEPDNKIITDYIECHQGKDGTFPQCRHKFIDRGLLYYSSYNREKYFSDRQSLKQGVIAFVDGFEIKN